MEAEANYYPAERKALHAALAAAQGEFPPIPRDRTVQVQTRTGGSYTFSYAPLDTILNVIRPVLAKHGLAVVQRLENPGGHAAIRTEILHVEGESLAASFPLGELPELVQQLGSKITYLRRYALCAILCLAAEDDDDGGSGPGTGKAAGGARQDPTPPAVAGSRFATPGVSNAQLGKIHALFRELGIVDRVDGLAYVDRTIGHPVASTRDLSMTEASAVIDKATDDLAKLSTAGEGSLENVRELDLEP